MSSENVITYWNDVFSMKITPADLKTPTHSFLYRAFLCFLKHIHIDVDKVKSKIKSDDVERQFRIYLVMYINHFLKVTKTPIKSFSYIDLMHPQPNKTTAVLKVLGNYALYFRMIKEDMLKVANEKLETYDKLKAQKTKLQVQHEEAKIECANQELALQNYTKNISENKNLLEVLKAKCENLNKDTDVTSKQCQTVLAENIEIDYQITLLKSSVVTTEEVDTLTKSIQSANQKISDLDVAEKKVLKDNEQYVNEIKQLNSEINIFDMAALESVIDGNDKYREDIKQLNEVNRKTEEIQIKIEEVTNRVNKNKKDIQLSQEELLDKKKNLESQLTHCRNKEMALESKRNGLALQDIAFQQSLKSAAHELEELRSTQEFILANGTEVIQHIEK